MFQGPNHPLQALYAKRNCCPLAANTPARMSFHILRYKSQTVNRKSHQQLRVERPTPSHTALIQTQHQRQNFVPARISPPRFGDSIHHDRQIECVRFETLDFSKECVVLVFFDSEWHHLQRKKTKNVGPQVTSNQDHAGASLLTSSAEIHILPASEPANTRRLHAKEFATTWAITSLQLDSVISAKAEPPR